MVATRCPVPIKGSLNSLASCRHLHILFCELITTTEALICRWSKSYYMNPISDTCIALIKAYEEKYRKFPSSHAHSLTWMELLWFTQVEFIIYEVVLSLYAWERGTLAWSQDDVLDSQNEKQQGSQVPPVWNNFLPWRLGVFHNMAWANIQWRRNPISFNQLWMRFLVCTCDLQQTKMSVTSATQISF